MSCRIAVVIHRTDVSGNRVRWCRGCLVEVELSFWNRGAHLIVYIRQICACRYLRTSCASVDFRGRSDFDGSDAAKKRMKVRTQQGRRHASIAAYSVATVCTNQAGYHCLADWQKVSVQAFLDLAFLHFLCVAGLADAAPPRNPQLAQNARPLRRSAHQTRRVPSVYCARPNSIAACLQPLPVIIQRCTVNNTSPRHSHRHHRHQHRRRCRPTATQSATPALTRDAIPRTDLSARVARCVRSPVFAPTAT